MKDINRELNSISPLVYFAFGVYRKMMGAFENEMLNSFHGRDVKLQQEQLNHIPWRVSRFTQHFERNLKLGFNWLFESNELTNHTYNLTEENKTYLASFLSVVTNVSEDIIDCYIKELEEDSSLQNHVRNKISQSQFAATADLKAKYGRRLGWYAIVRAKKPKVVVETGVDKGLGSCVLAAALLKNAQEGSPGYYYGTDINPNAGYLFEAPYNTTGEIIYGDSIDTLSKLNKKIDILITDSAHEADYEYREYQSAQESINEQSIIVSDEGSQALLRYARESNRKFLLFREVPDAHWYAGANMGVAFSA